MSDIVKPQISLPKKKRHVNDIPFPIVDCEYCIDCGECELICPTKAMIVLGDMIYIDESKCGKCRLCAAVCPVEAII
jgi:Dissimilatory sulfite reductase (desulfoviridin), alpha and beta subunits